MQKCILTDLVSAFNLRNFARASSMASEGLLHAQGRDEVFWMGLGDACEGFRHLMAGDEERAEHHMIAAMQNLRNFGFSHDGFQVTTLLAGIRRSVEEMRVVKAQEKRIFDVTLLPQLKLVETQANV